MEISPNITAEMNVRGELIGIEILNASTYLRDSLMESAHARVMGRLGGSGATVVRDGKD